MPRRRGAKTIVGSDRSFNLNTLYVAARRAEIGALSAQGETLNTWRLVPAPSSPLNRAVKDC